MWKHVGVCLLHEESELGVSEEVGEGEDSEWV
jgi:hypothetical protein